MFLERKRARFLRGKVPMADANFAAQLRDGSSDVSVVTAIRRVIAKLCGVPAEMLHPDDDPCEISAIMGSWLTDGWDALTFILELEDELRLKARIPRDDVPSLVGWRVFFWGAEAPKSFGDWVVAVANWLRNAPKE